MPLNVTRGVLPPDGNFSRDDPKNFEITKDIVGLGI